MEAILKFNLPEENSDFRYAVNGLKYSCIIYSLDQFLREKVKYDVNLDENARNAYDDIRTKIRDLLLDEGLSFTDIES